MEDKGVVTKVEVSDHATLERIAARSEWSQEEHKAQK
jgi:hypothetical protein